MPSSQFVAMAQAFGVIAAAQYPFTVTFSRTGQTKGTSGGNINSGPTNTTPANVPCRYRPASGSEVELAGKTIAGIAYSIFVPNIYANALVDVDSKCSGAIAAVSGFEPARSFSVVAPLREMGIEIMVLVSMEG